EWNFRRARNSRMAGSGLGGRCGERSTGREERYIEASPLRTGSPYPVEAEKRGAPFSFCLDRKSNGSHRPPPPASFLRHEAAPLRRSEGTTPRTYGAPRCASPPFSALSKTRASRWPRRSRPRLSLPPSTTLRVRVLPLRQHCALSPARSTLPTAWRTDPCTTTPLPHTTSVYASRSHA